MLLLILKVLLILFSVSIFTIFILLLFPLKVVAKYNTHGFESEFEINYLYSGLKILKNRKKTITQKYLGPIKWFSEDLNSNEDDDIDLQFFSENKYFILFNRYRNSINLSIKFVFSFLKKLLKLFSDWRIDINLNYSFENFELAGKVFAFFSAFRNLFKRITVIPNIIYSPDNEFNMNVYSELSIKPIFLFLVIITLIFEKNTWLLGFTALKEWLKSRKKSHLK